MTYVLIELHGLILGVRLHGERALQALKLAIGSTPLRPVSCDHESERVLTVMLEWTKQDLRWSIVDEQQKKTFKGVHIGDFAYFFTDCLAYHLADSNRQAHCIHAASVSLNGGACLFAGASGSGKSSLTAWLVSLGAKYITDELSLIMGDAAVLGLPRPIQIKRSGVAAITDSNLIVNRADVLDGDSVIGLTVSALGGIEVTPSERSTLASIVFPKYDSDSTACLTKLSRAEAGIKLMGNFINARNLPGHGFESLMGIVEKVPAYSLTYPSFQSLAGVFDINVFTAFNEELSEVDV